MEELVEEDYEDSHIYIISFSASFFSLLSFVSAQNKKTTGIDSSVPARTRERLKERLQVLIELQKAKNYEKLYSLLTTNGTDSKESFIKSNETLDALGRAELLIFIPKETYLLEPGNDWGFIKGCGEYVEKGKKKYFESQVESAYENGDWYFRSLIGVSGGNGTKVKKCSMQK